MSGHPDGTPRQGYRFRTEISAEIGRNGETFGCGTVNISRGGALVVGELPARPEDTVEFALKAPAGPFTIRVSAKVLRVVPNPDGAGVRIAIKFIDLTDSQREDLEVLLARILAAPAANPLESLKPGASLMEIKKALDSIPVSQRVALSSRAPAKEREYLRLDTNAAVLEALARNPGLTVAEARALAASAYLMPGTLEALVNDSRFKNDHELCVAVAIHPRASVATAEKATADFKVPQLKALLAKSGLNQALRDKLFRRTTRGAGGRS
jgi:hypothetical protein